MAQRSPVVLITGAASGIGSATANLLSANGFVVEGADIAVSAATPWQVSTVDVRDDIAVRAWVEAVRARHGRIDAVLTFAGYGLVGALEETSDEEAVALLDVNLLGTARVVRAALPALRRSSGRVVLVSSGSASTAQPFGGWYAAGKAAIEKLGETLRLEAEQSGVAVSVLVPGWTSTGVLDRARTARSELARYGAARAHNAALMAKYCEEGQEPEAVAAAALRILTAEHPRATYRVGSDVRTSHVVRRILPAALYARLVRGYWGIGATPVTTGVPLSELVDPVSREALVASDDGSLVAPDGRVALRVVDKDLRLYRDAAAPEHQEREIDSDKVRFAYRIYSKAYPLIATLVFWFVWNGDLRTLGRFYGARLRDAAERETTFVDVGVGDGTLTGFAVKTAGVRALPPLLFVDLSPDMLVKTAKRFRTADSVSLVQDVMTLGLREGSVRALGCYGALHVFPKPEAALRHLSGLLAEDGELSLSILTSPGVAWKDRVIAWFVRTNTITSNFTQDEVRQLLVAAGLDTVEEIHNGHQLLIRARRAA
ncbi:SDR family NAD(P)-dependent oxidoreductase [Nocardia noduli]|uniref:SDR family NAD(P)-dependent oxidoreductase n=1 Tax=Nocardia noduli TaxID=2815722 RepID=UPI001C21C2E6|nr:SDR family NAD(P)-dependent oxidoreductase [Nocardia noduli]